MKYDLEKTYDQQKAKEYLHKLTKDGSKAELKKIYPRRSTDQNSYIHVLFKLWGDEYGYFMDETKQTVKHALGYYTLNGTGAMIYKKTSGMDTKELATFTEHFRDWSNVNGLYLPTSKEYLEEKLYFDNLTEK